MVLILETLLEQMRHIGLILIFVFFFQAEDGIRDAQESRGLGDVYKRQDYRGICMAIGVGPFRFHIPTAVSAKVIPH